MKPPTHAAVWGTFALARSTDAVWACWRDRERGTQQKPDAYGREFTAEAAERAALAWLRAQGIDTSKRSDQLVAAWAGNWRSPPPDAPRGERGARVEGEFVVHFDPTTGEPCEHRVTTKTSTQVRFIGACGGTTGKTCVVDRAAYDAPDGSMHAASPWVEFYRVGSTIEAAKRAQARQRSQSNDAHRRASQSTDDASRWFAEFCRAFGANAAGPRVPVSPSWDPVVHEAAGELGLQPSFTKADLRAAWKLAAFAHHPDRPNGNAQRFIRVRNAYEVCSRAIGGT